jgi:2-hydroxy-3-oxopropionate reductase
MTEIGFIGLGIMGRPMAGHLLAAGHRMAVNSRRQSSAGDLISRGATWYDDPASLARESEIVITMLPDSPDVRVVALAEGGVFDGLAPGSLYIDMSTIRPAVARELAARGADRGIGTLDAPVSGGEAGAINGTLSIMVGGSSEDFERARPMFEVMGKTISHVGPAGAGQTVKATNQLLVGGAIELLAEAVLLLERSGVDFSSAVDVLAGGLAGSRVLDAKAAGMRARRFTPGFRIDLHHKDMGIVQDLARELSVPLPLGAQVTQLFLAARAQGLGDLDHSGLLRALEKAAGAGTVP